MVAIDDAAGHVEPTWSAGAVDAAAGTLEGAAGLCIVGGVLGASTGELVGHGLLLGALAGLLIGAPIGCYAYLRRQRRPEAGATTGVLVLIVGVVLVALRILAVAGLLEIETPGYFEGNQADDLAVSLVVLGASLPALAVAAVLARLGATRLVPWYETRSVRAKVLVPATALLFVLPVGVAVRTVIGRLSPNPTEQDFESFRIQDAVGSAVQNQALELARFARLGALVGGLSDALDSRDAASAVESLRRVASRNYPELLVAVGRDGTTVAELAPADPGYAEPRSLEDARQLGQGTAWSDRPEVAAALQGAGGPTTTILGITRGSQWLLIAAHPVRRPGSGDRVGVLLSGVALERVRVASGIAAMAPVGVYGPDSQLLSDTPDLFMPERFTPRRDGRPTVVTAPETGERMRLEPVNRGTPLVDYPPGTLESGGTTGGDLDWAWVPGRVPTVVVGQLVEGTSAAEDALRVGSLFAVAGGSLVALWWLVRRAIPAA